MALISGRMRSRRTSNSAHRWRTISCGPFSAATAAAWLMELGLAVLCDCILPIALMSSAGPPA